MNTESGIASTIKLTAEAAEADDVKKAEAALQKGIADRLPLKEIDRLYVTYMLATNRGNKVHTARALGIDPRTIQRWKIKL